MCARNRHITWVQQETTNQLKKERKKIITQKLNYAGKREKENS